MIINLLAAAQSSNMSSKIALVFCVFSIIAIHVALAGVSRNIREDRPTESSDAAIVIDKIIEETGKKAADLFQEIQNSDLFGDLSSAFSKMQDSIRTHGQDFMEKIQMVTST